MEFHRLSARHGSAADNMATDFLLLRRVAGPPQIRFRHYGWQRPAFTFGYSQKIADVRAQLPTGDVYLEITRRATGGGVVDHRHDWTYALIIPRGHALEEEPAPKSYRAVHAALLSALQDQRIPAELENGRGAPASADGPAAICFARAEISDVVHTRTRQKISGAAQKRSREGLLLQGSIARQALGDVGTFDWERFEESFTAALGETLQLPPKSHPWPEINEEELSALTDQYASPEWTNLR